MSIESALYDHLAADTGLTALVSTRIYPAPKPEKATLPAITIQRISTLPIQHRGNAAVEFSRPRFQFDVWATTRASAIAVSTALAAALATLAQASSPRIDVALMQDRRDVSDAATGAQRSTMDYFIWHQE